LIIGLVALSVLLGGCTHLYQPAEYVIADERIPGIPVGPPIRIVGEPSAMNDQVVFTQGVHTWVTNYSEVTTALVAQLTKEMTKRGQPVSDSASKTIRLTVLSLEANGHFAIDASMLLRLQLGAARPKELSIFNKSWANLDRALNGTIARAVMQILSDPDVYAFLRDMPASNPS
jgi:hypothetical protein